MDVEQKVDVILDSIRSELRANLLSGKKASILIEVKQARIVRITHHIRLITRDGIETWNKKLIK